MSLIDIMVSTTRTILVTGATGQQGGATVRALVTLNQAAPSPKYKILALTRDASSDKAAPLATLPNVSLNFSLQAWTKPEEEEKEARDLVDLAVKHGVQHVVYTSVDYCGTDENALPAMEGKRHVERYLQSNKSLPTYTILRPTGFMENFYWPAYLQLVSSKMNPNLKYKLIAVNDIGYTVASAFEDPATFGGKAIDLAGDALTPAETIAAFKDVTGTVLDEKSPPELPPEFKTAFEFWDQHEFVADPAACRKLLPELVTLRQWLATSSFKK
ncbi:NAD(P)-binding protein [Hymenopellis radicata]|nr:NAD(P)-binding protein [Hymenopellis radicata]